ncbi:hypothetical protein GMORB2_6124 [Geosmithia morbida]|uniref:Uncharacterized protein n=1 Tax=Geosmithia morbida TaxID=1094350 RepID=A0A9P5D134_9HYPO|nr:uncharacterized protein GMORB2_6124 [Geosmithia morbida]KAF4123423.1 hypothetical protein GMORB2_6124 [Geosmithia morbida]
MVAGSKFNTGRCLDVTEHPGPAGSRRQEPVMPSSTPGSCPSGHRGGADRAQGFRVAVTIGCHLDPTSGQPSDRAPGDVWADCRPRSESKPVIGYVDQGGYDGVLAQRHSGHPDSNGFPAAFSFEDLIDIFLYEPTIGTIMWDAAAKHINFTIGFLVEASYIQGGEREV